MIAIYLLLLAVEAQIEKSACHASELAAQNFSSPVQSNVAQTQCNSSWQQWNNNNSNFCGWGCSSHFRGRGRSGGGGRSGNGAPVPNIVWKVWALDLGFYVS